MLLAGLDPKDAAPISRQHETLTVAIAALAGRLGNPALLSSLRRVATFAIGRPPGEWTDVRSVRLANAAAQAIADIADPSSITELLALKRAVRHGTLLKQIREAIDALADAQGLTREELLERAVERHDLAEDGTRDVPLIAGTARIVVTGATVALTYIDPDGKPRKSVPAALKDGPDGEVLAVLRRNSKASAARCAFAPRRASQHVQLPERPLKPLRGSHLPPDPGPGADARPRLVLDAACVVGRRHRPWRGQALVRRVRALGAVLLHPITDVDPSGDLYPFVTSDQVRFDDAEGETLPLADIPRRVFTEALRDVDLFIGVTSIGADPEWLDHGEARQFDTYWQSYSFGDLTPRAKCAATCSSDSSRCSPSEIAARSRTASSPFAASCATTRSTSAAATS